MTVISTHLDCVAAIVTRMNALQLTRDGLDVVPPPVNPDDPPSNLMTVYNKTLPYDDKSRMLPYIIVCPFGKEKHDPLNGGSDLDIIQYPVLVGLVGAGNLGNLSTTSPTLWFGWRQISMLEFINKRLSGVTNVDYTYVEPMDTVEKNAWFDFNLYAGGFMVWCNARFARP